MKGSYQLESFTENRDAEILRLQAQVNLFFEKEFEEYKGFGLRDGMKIIDCGCGPGYLLSRIKEKFPSCDATGLEIDPFLIETLKRNAVSDNKRIIKVVEGSVYNTGMPDDYFDFAITRLVIEHLNEPLSALREIYRILRPGGKLIVVSNDFAYHLVTWPVIPELDEMYDAYCKSRFAEGGNPLTGRQMPLLMEKEGFSGIVLRVVNVHSCLEGDKAILNAENVNISKSLVNEGYLRKETLDELAAGWFNMLRNPDHSIYRQLFVCCGEKNTSLSIQPSAIQNESFTKATSDSIRADLTRTGHANRAMMINHFLKNEVRRIMGDESLKIENDTNLNDIDIDSIGAAELSGIISETFGQKISISDILQKLTIQDITAILIEGTNQVEDSPKEETGAQPIAIGESTSVISEIQEQFWVLHKLFPNGPAYNIPSLLKLTGKIDLQAFEYSINRVIQRHEALRARFYEKDNVVLQYVSKDNSLKYKPEVTRIDADFIPGFLPQIVAEEVHRPFDLTTWPLFRIRLFCFNNDVTLLCVVFHHIIIDLQSRIIFSNELSYFYNSYMQGRSDTGLPQPGRYSDYAGWLRNWLLTKDAEEKTGEWKDEISRINEILRLPADFTGNNVVTLEGRRKHFFFDMKMSSAIRSAADSFSVNPFTILLAAYSILLYRLANQKSIVIGVPLTNRRKKEFAETFGCFINIVPLLLEFTDDLTCSGAITQARHALLKAHARQEVPFLRLSKIARSNGKNSIFQSGFTMESPMTLSLQGIDIQSIEVDKQGAQLDLFLTMWEKEGQLRGYFEYSTKLYRDETAERFAEIFKEITCSMIENPAKPVSEIDIVPENELKRIISWNDTGHVYSDDKCLHHRLEEQSTRTPHLTAISYGSVELTYSELDRHVNRLANFLIASGVGIEDLVSVCMERSPELLIAIYAILKAGGAYLPVDPDYPQERIDAILKDAGPKLILTNRRSEKNIPSGYLKIMLDRIMSSPLSDNDTSPHTGVTSHNLAYVIYTSGSTGKPKGVMIEHHSVINKLEWMQHQHPMDHTDTILFKTPVTFDVSVWEIFWWMFNGAKVRILPPGAEKDPSAIIDETEQGKVTTIVFVPSMFSAFLAYLKSNRLSGRLMSLKWIIQIGEALSPSLVNSFNDLLTHEFNPLMVNTYGPTEATVAVSWYNCPKEKNIERIFIGKPIFNTRLLVLNSRNRIQPVGVPGELVITGVNLSRGYLHRPDLNAERFITIDYPDNRKLRGYKTGDLVKWVDDGNIDFIGRLDTQVKIRGYRIELGDIESAFNTFSKVKTSAVTVIDSVNDSHALAGYVVLRENEKATIEDIHCFLATKLPEYMIPSFILILEEMPLNNSGKIDRKRLPKPDPGALFETVAADSSYEKKLLGIFSRVLGMNNIGVTHNFFDIGGNSLLAIRVVAEIRDELKCHVEPIHLMEYPDIRRLARFIAGNIANNPQPQNEYDEKVRRRDFSGFRERRR
ncbi:MAG TPA: amino acid adenylation domain-containing protein [Bacteroidales bacterium]|nr:amino acid adenylation domain-containing protein [Bacteroidales bacterium]